MVLCNICSEIFLICIVNLNSVSIHDLVILMVNIIGEPYNSEMGLSVIFLHAVDIVFNGAVYVVVSYQEKNGQVNL